MVQPMVGKMILPLLGGSPAAWNTCMVFFQGLLLLGYLYAHNITSRYSPKRQTFLHLVVIGTAVLWLAIAAAVSPSHTPVAVFKTLAPQGQSYPIFGVLLLLSVAIGLPFLVISTSAPLLQRWFAYTGHPSAKDPYFLYAASNAGSLISLLGYPILIEPTLTLAQQAWVWAGGFFVLMFLVYLCGNAANNPLRPVKVRGRQDDITSDNPLLDTHPPTWMQKIKWMALAFVPSSLMLGVTFHMTTDIASVPLLWVIPLALYLLTFIIAFARTPDWFRIVMANLSPVLTLLLVFVLISNVMANRVFYALLIHLVVYFFTALLMHSELARARPHPVYLTGYFLWISIGGMIGGLFNALVAPVLFTVDYEYPIAIAIGCMLVPTLSETVTDAMNKKKSESEQGLGILLDLVIPIGMLGLVGWLTVMPEQTSWFLPACRWLARHSTEALAYCRLNIEFTSKTVVIFTLYALPCMFCFFFIDRPLRFGLCVAAVLFVCYWRTARVEGVVESHRSFFGIMRVEKYDEDFSPFEMRLYEEKDLNREDAHLAVMGGLGLLVTDVEPIKIYRYPQPFYKLLHGTTLHGVQAAKTWTVPILDDVPLLTAMNPWTALAFHGMYSHWDMTQEPLTYYHRTGPVGAIVKRLRDIDPNGHIGMVGLGTGSVACYAKAGQKLTFYEIDKTVVTLVEEGKYFTYVNDAKKRGADVNIILGDARIQLESNDEKYALLLIDAFSSDSIPIHLLTKQSMELYKSHLTEHGLLALHISNRYIDLEPVVARLAKDTGLEARLFSDNNDDSSGKTRSSWVILAKTEADLSDTVLGEAADLRYGSVAGAAGYVIYDNASFGTFVFPWKKMDVLPEVDTWTDDYSDVLRVMRLEEIRSIRRFFGLPVPKSP